MDDNPEWTCFCRAWPDESIKKQISGSGSKLIQSIQVALQKLQTKFGDNTDSALKADNLDKKFADVLDIILRRLQERVDTISQQLD
ncbi:unnamed protein product [Calicophoron daubneyi]|uniref:Uncharacterized protein n=1 Tax=Calicophoron daubneyi TaxID=300641 RepID=A0AAV2T716_CALDB